MRRTAWFISGAAVGVGATRFARKKAHEVAEKFTPDHVARQALDTARGKVTHVADAVRDGRNTMKNKEAELRARRDGHAVMGGRDDADVIDTTAVPRLDDFRRRRAR